MYKAHIVIIYRQVLEVVAKCMNIDEDVLAEQAYKNTLKVFFPQEFEELER
jgi:hypothetical protein